MVIKRTDTDYLKGIAILLMLAHHLFAFPERILPPSRFIHIFQGCPLEEYVGLFGKICVPVFLFLSGYGFAVKGIFSFRYYTEKVLRFLRIYWFYFIVFVPIGLVFFHGVTFFESSTLRYEAKPSLVLLNFFALTFSYNGEWWFVQPYLLLVLSAPFFIKGAKRPIFLIICSAVCAEISMYLNSRHFDTPYISAVQYMYWQFPFMMGILFGQYRIRISSVLSYAEKKGRIIPAVISVFSVWLLWHFFEVNGLVLATPLFVYCCLSVLRMIKMKGAIIGFIGSYSFPVWLIHSFFCYYYWQELVYFPKYSILVLANLTVLSLLSCVILEKVRGYISKRIKIILS